MLSIIYQKKYTLYFFLFCTFLNFPLVKALEWENEDSIYKRILIQSPLRSILIFSKEDLYTLDGNEVAHYNGSKWQEMGLDSAEKLNHIWGADNNHLFVVGEKGIILNYNGKTWTLMETPTTENLISIWGSNNQNIFAVGQKGTLLYYNGVIWHTVPTQTTEDFIGIMGRDENEIFIINKKGDIYSFNGQDWLETYINTSTDIKLSQFWVQNTESIYAISIKGQTYHYSTSSKKWQLFNKEQNQYTSAIWGDSTGTLFAIGSNNNILRDNGTGWQQFPIDKIDNADSLYYLSGKGSDFYVIGHRGTVIRFNSQESANLSSRNTIGNINALWDNTVVGDKGAILQFKDKKWELMQNPSNESLFDIWGLDHQPIFAVGKAGTMLHYNGTSWTGINSPVSTDLYAIWGSDREHIFVVGDNGTILFYNGQEWQQMEHSIEINLRAIWGVDENNIYAVGLGQQIIHYNGSIWQTINTDIPINKFVSIWGSSIDNIYAVGDNKVCHYNGESWQNITNNFKFENSSNQFKFTDIWGSSENNILVLSEQMIFHYDGETWTSRFTNEQRLFETIWGNNALDVRVISKRGANLHLNQIIEKGFEFNHSFDNANILSLSGDKADYMVAVGKQGAILEHKNQQWDRIVSPTENNLYSVFSVDQKQVFAVGEKGTILFSNGETWQQMTSNSDEKLYDIWAFNKNSAFAVGENGIILQYNGEIWEKIKSPTSNRLYSIWGRSKEDIYAVGIKETIIHYNGKEWSIANELKSGYSHLYKIWGAPNSPDIYAVGTNKSQMYHYTGIQWETIKINIRLPYRLSDFGTPMQAAPFLEIWGTSKSDIYIAGDEFSTVFHYDGNNWRSVHNNANFMDQNSHMIALWGNQNNVYAVQSGLLLHRLDKEALNIKKTKTIFNWAEKQFSTLFPNKMDTFELQGFLARGEYNKTKNYMGTKNKKVYVYGDIWGGLKEVGDLDKIYQQALGIIL